MDFRASGNRFIPLLDQIFALLTTPFPVPHPPAYQRLLRSYSLASSQEDHQDYWDRLHFRDVPYVLLAEFGDLTYR
jgi:hypothetical protein